MTSTALETRYPAKPPARLLGLTAADMNAIGKALQGSGFFTDVKTQSQAFTKILAGQELGVGPFEAMRGIHVIQGRLALSAGLVANLVKRSGRYRYKVTKQTADECELEWLERVDGKWDPVGTSSFTLAEAKKAGLVKSGGGWDRYPVDMLFARALTRGARRFAADTLGGSVYEESEIGEVPFDVESGVVTVAAPAPAEGSTDAKQVEKAGDAELPLGQAITQAYRGLTHDEQVEMASLVERFLAEDEIFTAGWLAKRYGETARDLEALLVQLRSDAADGEQQALGGEEQAL